MPRPRRSTSDAFYDVFADMPLEDQAAALEILKQVHRLALRESKQREGGRAILAGDTKLFIDDRPVTNIGEFGEEEPQQ